MRVSRFLRWTAILAGGAVVVVVSGAAALSFWLRPADMAQGPTAYGDATLEAVGESSARERERFLVAFAAPEGTDLPPLTAALERPCHLNGARVPAIVLLGGLRTGAEALDLVEFPGRVAIAALEYPYDRATWKPASALGRAKMGSGIAAATTEQAAALLDWLGQQPYVDPERVIYVGVSLGAIIGPAVLARAQESGGRADAAVLAYGGADLPVMLELALARWVAAETPRRLAAHWVAWIFGAYAPERHLPALAGPMLLVEADADELLPRESLAALRAAAPPDSEVAVLPGGHIEGSEEELVRATIITIRDWLRARGLIAPQELAAAESCASG